MLNINHEEAEAVRKLFPYVHIRRTVNKYYMEENSKAVRFVKSMRDGGYCDER